MKILYIPGWAAGRAADRRLVEELSLRFNVETIWLPDCGNDDWIPSQSISAVYRQPLLRRIEQEDGAIALVGWSLGAMTALEAAAEAPASVKALVIISGAAKFCADDTGDIGVSVQKLQSLAARLDADPEDALRGFFLAGYYPARPRPRALEGKIRGALEATPKQLLLGLDYLLRADLRCAARAVRMPALVVHGRQDAIIPVGFGQRLADDLPAARFFALDNAGHMLPDLHAGQLCSLVGPFLSSI